MDGSVGSVSVTLTRTIVILLLVGFAFIGYGGYDYVQQQSAIEDAVAVEATVVDTDIEKVGSRGTSYDVQIEYTYQYQGTEYTSDERFPGSISPTVDTRSSAESIQDRYDANETVTAYVDPAAPENAFLDRQTTNGPILFAGLGSFIVLVNILNAVGARKPGQETRMRPADEHQPTQYETLFGANRDQINRLSKRFAIGSILVIGLSILGVAGFLLSTDNSTVHVEPTDLIGLVLLAGVGAFLALIASVALYGIWSFTEYRRLRERIPEPKPPSPFHHPTRLVTIMFTNDGLDEYGKRIKRTGFAAVVVLFCLVVLSRLFVF